ncbi:2-hydroxychromene-2-carboxylate isomerase [Hyphomonas sp.]|uniref:2-hydroxychromene-2-carboxylate isomerase n=1 Tax=Hyphomonas sp. TaxID=87 RepID=UPI003D2A003D
MGVIEFWFEFASTYSYPAAMRIEALTSAAGHTVAWTPFLLGPLFHSQQGLTDSPFNAFPVKGRYMWRDFARVCAKEDLPLETPAVFPQNGLLAARCTLALPEEARAAFVKAVYTENFVRGAMISEPDVIARCVESAGQDSGAVLARSGSDEIKAELKANTGEAIRRGVFGSPTFFADDGEMFWGNDRLEDAIAWQDAPRKVKSIGGTK